MGLKEIIRKKIYKEKYSSESFIEFLTRGGGKDRKRNVFFLAKNRLCRSCKTIPDSDRRLL